MTALLGLLALAGYQNRDKLAELLLSERSWQPFSVRDLAGINLERALA
jgi:hypothetical protein